jgi:hypothetical protein
MRCNDAAGRPFSNSCGRLVLLHWHYGTCLGMSSSHPQRPSSIPSEAYRVWSHFRRRNGGVLKNDGISIHEIAHDPTLGFSIPERRWLRHWREALSAEGAIVLYTVRSVLCRAMFGGQRRCISKKATRVRLEFMRDGNARTGGVQVVDRFVPIL